MAKVYPIDRGIIDRTQKFLMNKRDKDGTWSNIGATHGETIERMGDPKLLLTSYVTWSLLESGLRPGDLKVSVDYIALHLADAGDNAYVLAQQSVKRRGVPADVANAVLFLSAPESVTPVNLPCSP